MIDNKNLDRLGNALRAAEDCRRLLSRITVAGVDSSLAAAIAQSLSDARALER